MRHDHRRCGSEGGRGLERHASPGEVEVVSAEGIHRAVVEAARAKAEDEEEGRAPGEESGEPRRGDDFSRVGSVRRHDHVAKLRRKTPVRELEGKEATCGGKLLDVPPSLSDARRRRKPLRDREGRIHRLPEGKTEGRKVRIERPCNGTRTGQGATMGFAEPDGVVRVEQTDRHAAAGHPPGMRASALF